QSGHCISTGVGQGYWTGTISVTNAQQYKQLLQTMGYTTNMAAGISSSPYLYLSIQLYQGSLPGAANLQLYPFMNGQYLQGLNSTVSATVNGNNTGLQLDYDFNFGGYQYFMANNLDIVTTFSNTAHTVMTTTLSFRGTAFAVGTMTGTVH